MISLLIHLIIALAVLAVLWYAVNWAINSLSFPEPIGNIVRILLVLVFFLIIIRLLLPLLATSGSYPLLGY